MASNITELVFVIDRSGSMSGMESDTIGGLNAVLERNRNLEGEVTVSTVLFDDKIEVLHDRLPINQVKPLTREDYWVRGCTALLDAIGGSIKHIQRVQGYMPQQYKADKVIFVITTDGYENASKKYTYPQIKNLIEKKTEDGWEFLFLGANIDAAAEATRMGIAPDRAATYYCDNEGTEAMYESVGNATCCMRSSNERINASWQAPIKLNAKKRGLGGFFK